MEFEIMGYMFHVSGVTLDGDNYLEYTIDLYYPPGSVTPSDEPVPDEVIRALEDAIAQDEISSRADRYYND